MKKAAALADRDLGVLDPKMADAIAGALDRLIAGEMRDQFVTDSSRVAPEPRPT